MIYLKPYQLLVLLFTLSTCVLFAQNKGSWADSTLNYLSENDIDSLYQEKPKLDSLNTIYSAQKDICSQLKVMLLYSEILLDSGKYEASLEKGMAFYGMYSPECDSILYVENCIFQAQNYNYIGDYQTALDRIESGFNYYNPNLGKTETLGNLYNTRAISYNRLTQYKVSIQDYRKSLDVFKNIGNVDAVQNLYFNIGVVKYYLNEIDSANFYFTNSIKTAQKENNPKGLCLAYNAMAGINTDYKTSIAYLDSALQIAIDNKLYVYVADFYGNIAVVESENNNYIEAYKNVWFMSEYKDSVFNFQMVSAIANMKEKYESEKKALKIANLTLQKQDAELESALYKANQVKLIVASLTLMLVVIVMTQRYYSIRKRKNILTTKNKIIAKEKDRSEELLLNILPKSVAEELKIHQKVKAKSFDNVTILFTDFKNFTSVTESMDPEMLVEEINICFRAFDNIIGKYGIEKIKTIGDAYLAAGGLNAPTASTAIDVVNAGIEIQAFMLNRKNELAQKQKTCFDMRVGIHTGPVVAGIVGVKKFQYDIWGDTVNTASRMESNCEIGKVNISEVTFNTVKRNDTLVFDSRGKIPVKGKGEMNMWYVA